MSASASSPPRKILVLALPQTTDLLPAFTAQLSKIVSKNGPFHAVFLPHSASSACALSSLDLELPDTPSPPPLIFNSSPEPAISKTDVLLLPDWPTGIETHSVQPPAFDPPSQSLSAAEAIQLHAPRYTFCVSGTPAFWERSPFPHHPPSRGGQGRFVHLSPFGLGARSHYAFSYDPASAPSQHVEGLGKNPWAKSEPLVGFKPAGSAVEKRKRDVPTAAASMAEGVPNFIFAVGDANAAYEGRPRGGNKRNRQDKREPLTSKNCWFCLSNPQVTKHLIISISEHSYLTFPKGPLTLENPAIPGGGHLLIIPISHLATMASADEELESERQGYVTALKTLYSKYSQVPILFELGRHGSQHAHVQCVPIPETSLETVTAAFLNAEGVRWESEQVDVQDRNYFKLVLPDGSTHTHFLSQDRSFDLQFGRSMLARSIPGWKGRADWRACEQTVEEEKQAVKAFKAEWRSVDPARVKS